MPLFGKKTAPTFAAPGLDSIPQTPRSDSLNLVPISAVLPPFLLRNDGTFVCMLEVPPLDMGISGDNLSFWSGAYQKALESLPPGTNFQLSVIMEPHDPRPDMEYFINKSKTWSEKTVEKNITDHQRYGFNSLGNAGVEMAAMLSDWYDQSRPRKMRTIITLTWAPPFQSVKGLFGGSKQPDVKVAESRALLPKAEKALGDQMSMIRSAFGHAGLPLIVLSPGEMCQVVWLSLHPIAANDPRISCATIAGNIIEGNDQSIKEPPMASVFTTDLSPNRLAELLAPDTVLESKSSLEIDGVLTSGFVISDFQANRPAFMERLNSQAGGWMGTMFIEVSEPAVMAEALKQKEVQKFSGQMIRQKQGMLEDFASTAQGNEIQHERAQLEVQGITPILIQFYVMKTGYNVSDLEDNVKGLTTYLNTIGSYSYCADYNQVNLWNSVIPVGYQALNQKPRNMNAPSLATFFWPDNHRFNEPDGIHLGIDRETKLTVRVDPFGNAAQKTPVYLAMGLPGAGKSVWLKSTIISTLFSGGSVIAIDIEGEMKGLCKQYGGRYIDVGTTSGERINVLDIPPDSDNPLTAGIEQFIGFFGAISNHPVEKGAEWNALAAAYTSVMKDRNWLSETSIDLSKWKNEEAPRLHDIYRVLTQQGDSISTSLANMIHPYSEGCYSSYFNTTTTFDIKDERLVIFGLKEVSQAKDKTQAQVYMWCIMSLIWGEILRRNHADPTMTNHVILDEVWLLMKLPGGGDAVENMARRFRKRRACLWMGTQTIGEFLDSNEGRNILSIASNVFMMKQGNIEIDRVQSILRFSDSVKNAVPGLETGEGILVTPAGTVRLMIMVPQYWGAV